MFWKLFTTKFTTQTAKIYTRQLHVIASKCKSKLKPKRDDMHKQNSGEPNDSCC